MNFSTVLFAFWVLYAVTPAQAQDQEAQRPAATAESAIVIVIDDVGWEDLAAVPTPTLDSLSTFGRTYHNTYASCVCSPSRYQLIFGLLPHREFIGNALVSKGWSPNHAGASVTTTSIASTLRAQGVRTAAFGKWHLNNDLGGNPLEKARRHGFESWRAGFLGNLNDGQTHYNWMRIDDGVESAENSYTTVAIEGALEEWWTSTAGRKFAYVAFAAAHAPFQDAPPKLLPLGYTVGSGKQSKYESSIIALDTVLARLGLYVDLSTTAVFIVCDNGTPDFVPPIGAKFQGYKLTQYEGGIRVPLFAIGAGVSPGNDWSLLQVVDIPRTVLNLLGCRPAVGFEDSISFAPTLDGSSAGSRPWAFLQRFKPNGGIASVLDDDDWAVVWPDGWKVLVQDGGAEQVYHLAGDLFETTNLAGTAVGSQKVAEAGDLRNRILGPAWPY